MNDIAPGWYKDPAEPTTQRYWDGEGWIGDPLPIDATPPSGPPPQKPAPAVTLPPPAPTPPPTPTATPAGWSPGAPHGGQIPPGPPPSPGAPPPPGASFPPGASWPPGRIPPRSVPPGVIPPGAMPPGPAPIVPPSAPPGTIPWPIGVPLPPGYRPFAAAVPLAHGLPIAPLGRRLVARLIDIAIVLALNVVATGWLVYLFLRDYLPIVRAVTSNSPLPPTPGRLTVLAWIIPVVAMVVWLAYEVPALAGTGQTLGKRTVGIKVMALESTGPLGFGRALRRWGLLGWPMFMWTCGLGFVLQLIDSLSPTWGGPMQLALHDRSAQTVVVHCGRRGHEIAPVNVPGKTGEQP